MRPVTFVVPGDLHLTDAGRENHGVALWVVEQVNTLIRPDFVQFIGDNAQEARPEQYQLFTDLCARLTVPYGALVGDHDVHQDPEAQTFRRLVGETYGARAFPGVCFLSLNTQQAKPVGLSPTQIAWFARQVEQANAQGDHVVIFQHNYPYQIWENFDGPGLEAWRAIVQTRRIDAVICGHTHYFQIANDGRNPAVAVRSIGDPEGGAPGYLIGSIQGDDLAFTYRTIADTGPIVLTTHPRETLLATGPKHIVCGPDTLRVAVWSEQPVVCVRYRMDTQEWRTLTRSAEGEWIGALRPEGLTKGVHRLEVEAHDAADAVGRQETTFIFDPTGRYTPVPRVHPAVTQTGFC